MFPTNKNFVQPHSTPPCTCTKSWSGIMFVSPCKLLDREYYEKLPLEAKRKLYTCGKNYKTLADIPTLEQHLQKSEFGLIGNQSQKQQVATGHFSCVSLRWPTKISHSTSGQSNSYRCTNQLRNLNFLLWTSICDIHVQLEPYALKVGSQ